jgi:hypothetical protein
MTIYNVQRFKYNFKGCGQHNVIPRNRKGMRMLFCYFFLTRHLYSIGVRFRDDQRIKDHKDTCLHEIGIRLQVLLTTSTSIMNTIARTHVFNQGIDKHAFFREP